MGDLQPCTPALVPAGQDGDEDGKGSEKPDEFGHRDVQGLSLNNQSEAVAVEDNREDEELGFVLQSSHVFQAGCPSLMIGGREQQRRVEEKQVERGHHRLIIHHIAP